jgi:hypothetical protein
MEKDVEHTELLLDEDSNSVFHEFKWKEASAKLSYHPDFKKLVLTDFHNAPEDKGNGKKLLCYALTFLQKKGDDINEIDVYPVSIGRGKDGKAKLEAYYAKYGFRKNPGNSSMTASFNTVIEHCKKSGGRIRSTRRRLGGRLYRKRGSAYSRGTRR